MNTPNVDAGRLERWVRRDQNEAEAVALGSLVLSLTENEIPPIEWEREKLHKITLNVEAIRCESEPFDIVPVLEDMIKQVKKMKIDGFYGSLKPETGIDWSITTNCPLIADCSAQLPSSFDLDWGSGRRFYMPFPVSNPDGFNHFFGRSFVPTNAYLLEIDANLIRRADPDSFRRKKGIRLVIERTCGVKFRNGARGFCQGFLKHLAPASMIKSTRIQNFRKQRRSKINKPSFYLNPTMVRFFHDGRVAMEFVCKSNNNLVKVVEVVYDATGHRDCF